MEIQIKRLDASLPLPEYHTPGAVAFDLYARTDTTIGSQTFGRIPTNLIVKIPDGFMLLVNARGSTEQKTGLIVIPGIIDQDFCGPDDEIQVRVWNPGAEDRTVSRGDRFAQAIFVQIGKAMLQEVSEMTGKSRGGFGSTGGYAEK